MQKSQSNIRGNDIWSLITPDQLAVAIVSLGDRIDNLERESWRLNDQTRVTTSLWAAVTTKVGLDNNEKNRQSLYKVWRLDRQDIRNRVRQEMKKVKKIKNDGHDGNIDATEDVSVLQNEISNLDPDPSLSLPQRPNTRDKCKEDPSIDTSPNITTSETSFVLSPSEWKAAFSRTQKKMNDGWRKILYDKLISCGITCSMSFRKAHIKTGTRKQACRFFWCRGDCSISICQRSFIIILNNQPAENASALFLVRIIGEDNHDAQAEKHVRQLRGEERMIVGKQLNMYFLVLCPNELLIEGKRVNEIGPLAVFRERVDAADEKLIATGNHTGCETIQVLKKAGADYRTKMQIDEDIFTECRIICDTYRIEDNESVHIKGKLIIYLEKTCY